MNKLILTILLLLFSNTVFADIFKKIEVKGNDRIDKKVIIEYSNLKVNRNYAESDLNEALSLRLRAYRDRHGANLEAFKNLDAMTDRFDSHSVIFTMRVAGEPVGTGRLILNNGRTELSEIGSMAKLPDWLWKAGFVEFSRFATDEAYRGRDVFSGLSLHASRVAHQLGYRYIVADCEAHLLPMYKKRGAKSLGVSFTHPLEGIPLQVIYYDLKMLRLLTRFLAPRSWAKTWGALIEYYQPK